MSVFLVGGGFRDGTEESVYGGFVAEAAARASARGRVSGRASEGAVAGPGSGGAPVADEARPAAVVVLTVREDAHPGHGETLAEIVWGLAGDRPLDVTTTVVAEGERMPASALEGADGILVGGGLTPAYLQAFAPLAERIRSMVSSGVPYLGFSAGAMIAPDRALLGGWLIGGIEIGDQDAAEELEELTLEEGLGLIDVTVDVHAVQWGNLSRAIAAVDSGVLDQVIAIDESTVLTVGSGPLRAGGAGTVWAVTKDERGVLVRSMR
jgi:cyanophycinase